VVALKHLKLEDIAHHPSKKQERRGGIETSLDISSGRAHGQEAGTPWWH
jgi:hypothetical protein